MTNPLTPASTGPVLAPPTEPMLELAQRMAVGKARIWRGLDADSKQFVWKEYETGVGSDGLMLVGLVTRQANGLLSRTMIEPHPEHASEYAQEYVISDHGRVVLAEMTTTQPVTNATLLALKRGDVIEVIPGHATHPGRHAARGDWTAAVVSAVGETMNGEVNLWAMVEGTKLHFTATSSQVRFVPAGADVNVVGPRHELLVQHNIGGTFDRLLGRINGGDWRTVYSEEILYDGREWREVAQERADRVDLTEPWRIVAYRSDCTGPVGELYGPTCYPRTVREGDRGPLGRYADDPRVTGTEPHFRLGDGRAVWVINNPLGRGQAWAAGYDGTHGTTEEIGSVHYTCESAVRAMLGDPIDNDSVEPDDQPEPGNDPRGDVKALKDCAKLLHDLAGKATPGPWMRGVVKGKSADTHMYRLLAGIDTTAAEAGSLVAEFPRGTVRRDANSQLAAVMDPDTVRALATLMDGLAKMREAAIRDAHKACTEVSTSPVELKAAAIAKTLLNKAEVARAIDQAVEKATKP